MAKNNFESDLIKRINGKWETMTPTLQIQVYKNGLKKIDLQFGPYYKNYDLASLTKALFTSRIFMNQFEAKKWDSMTEVKNTLTWWSDPETKILDLFTHHAGLEWWKPFYKDLNLLPENEQLRMNILENIISKISLQKSEKSVYSDLDMFVLGFILQNWTNKNLLENWNSNQSHWDLKGNLHFNKVFNNNLSNSKTELLSYAPTEFETGIVHDENARALGGVAPHAGLFGSIDDVSEYLLLLRNILKNPEDKKNPVQFKTLTWFLTRAIQPNVGDWAIGWMMPTPGSASSGKYFDPSSVGHTGFTGTSMWWDLKKDLIVVILSNRVAMGRENKQFAQLRPFLHDQVIEVLNL